MWRSRPPRRSRMCSCRHRETTPVPPTVFILGRGTLVATNNTVPTVLQNKTHVNRFQDGSAAERRRQRRRRRLRRQRGDGHSRAGPREHPDQAPRRRLQAARAAQVGRRAAGRAHVHDEEIERQLDPVEAVQVEVVGDGRPPSFFLCRHVRRRRR